MKKLIKVVVALSLVVSSGSSVFAEKKVNDDKGIPAHVLEEVNKKIEQK